MPDQQVKFIPEQKIIQFVAPVGAGLGLFEAAIRVAIEEIERAKKLALYASDDDRLSACHEALASLNFMWGVVKEVIQTETEEEEAFYAAQEETKDEVLPD